MAKTRVSEWSTTPSSNTDIDGINISEGCAPSGINDAIRDMMAQIRSWQSGTYGDTFNGPVNGTVGATTPATGAFTTLSASSTVTLSGGTANGVTYLNGSKVLTSGSALTFDGTNLGVGVASASYGVDVRGASGVGIQIYETSTGNNNRLIITQQATVSTYNSTFSTGSGAQAWQLGGSEQMRLTSTGLGIGTSSPSTKVEAAGNIKVSYAASGANASLISNNTSSTAGSMSQIIATNDASRALRIQYSSSGGAGGSALSGGFSGEVAQIFTDNAYPLSIGTSGVSWLNLNTTGNLGLGVTPSAWQSGAKAIEIGGNGYLAFTGGTAGGYLYNNAYINTSGTNTYKATGFANALGVGPSGEFRFFNAPSGTAGNAITFTQALTLTAAGDLLVGTTSYSGSTNGNYIMAGASDGTIWASHASGTSSGKAFVNFRYNGTDIGSITQSGTTAVAYNTSSDYRLKNITGPITNSGAYIDSLNPVEGTWKADGSTFVGLIAHEVQEASRTQVATGTKDGAEMQAMDYSNSELIANLIAEVKSLRQRVATLEAK